MHSADCLFMFARTGLHLHVRAHAHSTVKGLVCVCQRQRERHPQKDKRGSVNTLSTLCRYCLWTFQLKEILVSTFCPGWNVACKALFKCFGLNAMSATPHETVLIHFFFPPWFYYCWRKHLGLSRAPASGLYSHSTHPISQSQIIK